MSGKGIAEDDHGFVDIVKNCYMGGVGNNK